MITSRIFGGLGNQLFQYAAGRALALQNGDALQLDARLAGPGTHASYALDHFNIAAGPASPSDLPPAKDQPVRYAMWRAFGRNPKFEREKGLGLNPRFFDLRGDVYLHGYWQSELYFNKIEPQLREDLRIVTPPSDENTRWLADIGGVTAVSLHVRRGDYLAGGASNASLGTCDAAYYQRALDTVAAKVGEDLVVFVFSDDPDWARNNLEFSFETRFAGHNGSDKHYEDLRLISACDHNVIANSTFSWWGAWLNANPQKCVVAPTKWFNTDSDKNPDVIPASWQRV